jgi:hypothetical protein
MPNAQRAATGGSSRYAPIAVVKIAQDARDSSDEPSSAFFLSRDCFLRTQCLSSHTHPYLTSPSRPKFLIGIASAPEPRSKSIRRKHCGWSRQSLDSNCPLDVQISNQMENWSSPPMTLDSSKYSTSILEPSYVPSEKLSNPFTSSGFRPLLQMSSLVPMTQPSVFTT